MAIDPSIPLQAGAGQTSNPLAMLTGAMALKGQTLQQNALDQQIRANQAASLAYQQATNPQTGQVDYNRLTSLLANSDAAYNLPQIQASIAQQRNAQLENQQKQWDLAQKQVNWLKGGLGSLLNNPNATAQDVISFASTGIKQGFLTPEQAVEEMKSMPQDPAQLQGWIRNLYTQSLDSDAQLNAIRPQTQIVNTGGGQQILNVDPLTGRPTVAGNLQNTLSPESAAEMVQVTGADGTPYLVPKGQLLGQGASAMGGNGRYPGTPGFNPDAGGVPGGVQSGPRPGQLAGAETASRGAAERFNTLMSDTEGTRNTIAGYDNALSALDNLGTSGPGIGSAMTVKAGLEAFGLTPAGDDTKDWQALHKYLENAANEGARSAGYNGSDAGRAMFRGGQPNADTMNPGALKEAIQYVRAQAAGKLAKQQAAQQFADSNGGDFTKYSQFETAWNKAYNPDAMYLSSLSDEDAAKYLKSLPANKLKSIEKSYDQMSALGAF